MSSSSSRSTAISCVYTSRSLLAARNPLLPIDSASAISPAAPEPSAMGWRTLGPRAAQHLYPPRDMLFFHARQVREDFGPLGVALRRGDASIEEGGVALVSPVLQPQLSLRRRAIALHVFCLNSKWTGRALPVYNDFGLRVPPASGRMRGRVATPG